ncbi:MAG: hypothetical protein F6K17_21725 [Okeania sp. SIO3C4]|nr:hypothetical protein [Okeania sp. SIO3C4]
MLKIVWGEISHAIFPSAFSIAAFCLLQGRSLLLFFRENLPEINGIYLFINSDRFTQNIHFWLYTQSWNFWRKGHPSPQPRMPSSVSIAMIVESSLSKYNLPPDSR